MKRAISLFIAALLVFSLAACGSTAGSGQTADTDSAPASSAENAENAENAADEAPAPVAPDRADEASVIEDSALEAEAEADPDLLPNEVRPDVSIAESAVNYPIYDETETFSVICAANSIVLSSMDPINTFNDAVPTENVEADTGVHLDFTVWNEGSCTENVQLAIVSGSYPDVWGFAIADKTNSSIEKLIEEEIVMDIVDLLPEYAPELQATMDADKKFANKLYSEDGSVGAVIGRQVDLVGSNGGLYIRMDMLEGMGYDDIDPNEHMSLDQLVDILRSAKSAYDCKLPLLIFRSMECGLGNSFNIIDDNLSNSTLSYQLKEPGQSDVIATMATENFRDYVEFLRGLYAEGLMTDDYTGIDWSLGTADQWALSNNTCVFVNSTNLSAMITVMDLSDPNYHAVALADPYAYEDMTIEVDTTGSGGFSAGGVSLSTQCHDPEGMVSYLNYFFCTEGRIYTNFGVEGISWEYDDDGVIQYTDNYLNNPEYSIATKEQHFKISWGAPSNGYQRAMELRYSTEQMDTINTWADGRSNGLVIPGMYMDTDASTELANISTDISTYLYERMYMTVVGDLTMEEWDASVDEAYNMGLGRCEEIYKDAVDKYIDKIGW